MTFMGPKARGTRVSGLGVVCGAAVGAYHSECFEHIPNFYDARLLWARQILIVLDASRCSSNP